MWPAPATDTGVPNCALAGRNLLIPSGEFSGHSAPSDIRISSKSREMNGLIFSDGSKSGLFSEKQAKQWRRHARTTDSLLHVLILMTIIGMAVL
ncbi:MAG TPA: hypothetical protein VGS20_06970 [Candidatus Acidoferrales bacterium]|nr:hypothetical protein [Candidatus Acidoferrales bacterium]